MLARTVRQGSARLYSTSTSAPQSSSVDVLIVGGGVMGSSSAFWLTRPEIRGLRVAVVEKDPTYARASSALAAGGIRQQFSNKENILLSQFSLNFMKDIDRYLGEGTAADFGLQLHGYCLLASTEEGKQVIEENVALQSSLGAKTVMCLPDDLKRRFPWLEVGDIVAGSYGTGDEGWFDPFSLLSSLRKKAQQQGTEYIAGEVVNVAKEGSRANAATVKLADGSERTIRFGHIVNAAGTSAGRIGKMLGWETCPVVPRKRYTFNVQTSGWVRGARKGVFRAGHEGEGVCAMPLLVSPNGVWIRPEGNGFICGVSPPAHMDPDVHPDDFDVREDSASLYEEVVWPTLASRVEGMDELRLVHQWPGHYEYNTVDQNAIIGIHPTCSNAIYANGFSGHGIQQSPAVGKCVSELILDGMFTTVDVTAMAPTRFESGQLLIEKNVV